MKTPLDQQFGMAKEPAYGQRQVPTKFFGFDTEAVVHNPTFHKSNRLAAGQYGHAASGHRKTVETNGGPVTMEVPSKGFGSILDLLVPDVVTPVQQGATAAHKSTFNYGAGDDPQKSATLQFGRDMDGTIKPFDYLGAVITGLTFSLSKAGVLMVTVEWDARQQLTNQALAAASYAAGVETFAFSDVSVSIDGTAADLIESIENLSIPIPRKTDRHALNTNGLKNRPRLNNKMAPTGLLTAEFGEMTHVERWQNGDIVPIVITATGDEIAAPYNHELAITMPACAIGGSTPTAGGPDVVTHSLPFEVLDDPAEPALVKFEYTSTDTTL